MRVLKLIIVLHICHTGLSIALIAYVVHSLCHSTDGPGILLFRAQKRICERLRSTRARRAATRTIGVLSDRPVRPAQRATSDLTRAIIFPGPTGGHCRTKDR